MFDKYIIGGVEMFFFIVLMILLCKVIELSV